MASRTKPAPEVDLLQADVALLVADCERYATLVLGPGGGIDAVVAPGGPGLPEALRLAVRLRKAEVADFLRQRRVVPFPKRSCERACSRSGFRMQHAAA